MSFCKFSIEDFICRYLKKLFKKTKSFSLPISCQCSISMFVSLSENRSYSGDIKIDHLREMVIILSFLFVLWKSSHRAQNIQMLFQEPYHCPPQKLGSKILIILYSYKKLKLLKPLKCPDNHLLHLFCGF